LSAQSDPFRDRTAVVTGGAAGIGLAMARAFASRGARLVLADIDEQALAVAEKELAQGGARVLGVPTDVRERAQLQALAETSLRRFGRVHILCNNAGIAVFGPLSQATPQEWETSFAINFWGVVHGVEAFLPHLLEHGDGHVVNTASMAGLTGMLGLGIYCATKFAVVGYTESLQRELEPQGIGVSVLCPMIVRTGIGENSRRLLGRPEPGGGADAGLPPPGFGSVIAPEEVADRVVRAIERRELYILTHPEQREILRRRFERQDAAFERAG
jgi:NAD(P)-dependent dehydrogenase (short-subunit alcohol dehydrogenase family)